MANTWITDIRHFLDSGHLAPSLPAPARKLAEYFGAIVVAVTSDDVGAPESSGVRCRRRPKRQSCPGEIRALVDPLEDAIHWCCPTCGDNGVIRGWNGTLWDCSERDLVH